MDAFNLKMTVEVEQVGNGLAIQQPVDLEIGFNAGEWQARAEAPRFESAAAESLEKAIMFGAEQAKAELQSMVIERPRIVARITPEEVLRML
jgi:hypothetical protein